MKKLLLVLVLVCGMAGPSWGAYSLVAHTVKGSAAGDSITSDAIDTSGSSLLVFCLSDLNGVTTISDSKSNTWSALTLQTSTVNGRCFYAANPTVGTGHTFTATDVGGYPSIFIQAWSGAKTTSPFDQQNGAGAGFGTTIQAGSITPSEDNELVVAFLGTNQTPTMTIDSSYTISDSTTNLGNNFAGAMAYKVQTTATATNPTWTLNPGENYSVAVIASFKVPAATSGTAHALPLMGVGH